MRTLIRFSIIVLFLVLGQQAATAQTSPTRLRLKQLELAPDSTEHVITSDTNRVAVWTKLDSVLFGTVTGPLTAGRIPRATGTYTLGDGVLRDDGTLLALGGVTVSGYSFYDYSTGAWRLATGTTAQRPTNIAGLLRYNTSLGYSETGNGSNWLQSDFPAGTTGQTLRHDGTSWIANSFLYNRGDYVGINFSGTPANTLHVAGGVTVEESGTGNDFFSMSGSTGFINFGNRAAGWGMATSATGSSDEDGAVWRFFPSTRYDDSGFTNIGYVFLGRINTNQTVNHTIFQIRDEGTAAPTSGTSTRTYLDIFPQPNKGASANLTVVGIQVNPVITSVTDFYALNITNNAYKAIWQSGASATNHLAGNTIIGSTSTPAQTLHVAGTMRLTGSDGTATKVMGVDADGDVSANTPGFGLAYTGGVLQVDSTKIATQSDLASVSVTTLYTGDGTIATDRTVTLASDKTLTISGTTPDLPGYLFTEEKGYSSDWDTWGNYRLISTDDYFTNFVQGILNYDSTVFLRISAGDQIGDHYVSLQMDGAGNLSLTGFDDSGTSAGLNLSDNATLGGYGARLAGGTGIEFDVDTGGKFVYQVNNSTKATLDGTGLGINDTSPEKSLDVGGMGKFRQLSGQDNSVTIGTNANAGTGRSASITDSQSSDVAGRFSFTSGTTLTAGEWVTLTWGAAFDNAPAVVLMPENANGASIVPYLYVVPSTTGCSIVVNVTGVPYEGLTYEFNYIVIQGK